MTAESLLLRLAAIAVLGVAAQWVAWRLRLPSILLLLVVGLAVGPGSVLLGAERALLEPDRMLGELLRPLVSLSVAVILFEGGLTLDLRQLSGIRATLLRLCTVGVAVTWALAAALAYLLVELPIGLSLLVGAILTVTGPTVVGPLLRYVRPKGAVASVANWEGIAVDVVGATLAVLVFHALVEGEGLAGATAWGLVQTIFVGGVAGLVGAIALAEPLRRRWIPDALESPAALATALGVYALADHLQPESGLLAVTLVGVVLRNQESTPIKHIVEFKENLRTLLISSLFIVLAARVELDALQGLGWREALFVAALILVVRPVAVWASTVGTSLPRAERVFLAFLAPRGIVAAAVSALFGEQLMELAAPEFFEADRIAPLTFLVIIGTVGVYGLTAPMLARWLGLAESSPQGALVVGASPFALDLAQALRQAGLAAVVVDTNRASVASAKLAGLTAVYGSALAEDAEHRLPLFGVGRLFAVTPNDEVNSLAALHYAELFGRGECYQLMPAGTGAKATPTPASLRGRTLFGPDATYAELARRTSAGWSVRSTPLTDTFDFEAWREHHGPDALPLLRVEEGRLAVFTADDTPALASGSVLVGLVPPETGAPPEEASAQAPPAEDA